jgi:hypothetical protein
VLSSIRFDMRAPADGPASAVDLYQATLDMAAWADRAGIGSVILSEHHGVDDGFLPSPIVAAAAGRSGSPSPSGRCCSPSTTRCGWRRTSPCST